MNPLSQKELAALAGTRSGPWVSLYETVGVTNEATDAATIRLKDRLRECENALVRSGMRPTDARALVSPISSLVEDNLASVRGCRGLAIFASPEGCRIERLPVEVEDVAWVGPRPYIRPLIALVQRNRPFWLLGISQNRARLFRGDMHGLTEEQVPDMPIALAEVIDTGSRDGTQQSHTAKAGTSVKQDAAFHGQGGLADHRKTNIIKFFREVDRALQAHLRGDTGPLLFTGVDYLYPLFASVTRHPQLLDEHIAENPDRLTAEELYRQAERLLHRLWEHKQAEVVRSFENGLGSCEVSDEVHVILPAAAAGQVKSLLVRQSGPLWGTFDSEHGKIHVDHEQRPGTEDLLDRACAEVLLHGGGVFAVPWQKIKTGAPLAAIFRYALSPPPTASAVK
ncbi:MAG TPA: hypothetical protein VGN12_03370 [Pirellulales bacterium]|jgi:hypothetical protein